MVIKDIRYFYKHPRMSDGHIGKCKLCARQDVKNRYDNPEVKQKIVEYEKLRSQSHKRKLQAKLQHQKQRQKYPGKFRARNKVANAIRDGRLQRKACEVCGELKSEAHHEDYRKYLQVRWLCRKHHVELEKQLTNKF